MEALTAVQVGLLAVFDMCKAIDKSMVMGPVYLVEKRVARAVILLIIIDRLSKF